MGVASVALAGSVRERPWRAFDVQLFCYMLLLMGFGVVVGYSAGYNEPAASGALSQVVKTLIWAGIGMAAYFVLASVDYHWLEPVALPIYLAVVGLLGLTMLVGTELFGARMSVTVAGLDFQFSEISKVLMIIVLACYLTKRSGRIGSLPTLVGAGAVMALPTLLVFRQPDLGTALVYVAILAGMLFMSGASLGWMALLAAPVVAAAPAAVALLHDYQRLRLFCFLDPAADPQGACYQLLQGLDAVRSGGWLGQGLTAGRLNQLGLLPVQSSDFIFTVVAEELGFLGALGLLALFGLLLWRILLIGWSAQDALGALVAFGLGSMLLFQICVNIGMVVGITPVTGIPLPFISYGGSSLVSLMLGLGILQSVRIRSRKPRF